jgi:hypothetical protein
VLLPGGPTVGGWTAKQIHEAILTSFRPSPKTYGLNQLRYELRKLKGRGLLQRDGAHYAPRTTPTANSEPPITRPTRRFRSSWIG